MAKAPVIIEPVCRICIWNYGHEWDECDAFPDGIPQTILNGENDHRDPWPKSKDYPNGDGGLQFEPL